MMRKSRNIMMALAAAIAALTLTGCAENGESITETIMKSVAIPEQYSIAYEVQTGDGVIRTIHKARDAEGNIYFRSGENEVLYLEEEGSYVRYEKDENGTFAADDSRTYTEDYAERETAEFRDCAERSREQFLPGLESSGEQEVLGRTCEVYDIRVGLDNAGVTYSFLVDKETGICLGWDESKNIAGVELGADGEIFSCTEFETEDIESLEHLLK